MYTHINVENLSSHSVHIKITCEGSHVADKTIHPKKKTHIKIGHTRCSGYSSLSELEFTATTHYKYKKTVLKKNSPISDGDTIKIHPDHNVKVISGVLRN